MCTYRIEARATVSEDSSIIGKHVHEQKVKGLMTKHVITLEPHDNLLRAQNEMLRYRIKKIVVVQPGKILEKIAIGILTVKDILKFLLQDRTSRSLYEMQISEAMTTNLVTAAQDESITNCARILALRNDISSIVIVKERSGLPANDMPPRTIDKRMLLAGIVTSTDLSEFYSENCAGLSSVDKYMSKPVITISINEKVRAAAELMVDKNVSLLGVISSNDNHKNMLGILSETEIARVTLAFKSKTQRSVSEYIGMIFSSPHKKNFDAFSEPSLVTIGDIFTPNPTLIERGADLAEAAMILTRNNNVSGLPVVESLRDETKRNQPIGIISKSDIVRALAKAE